MKYIIPTPATSFCIPVNNQNYHSLHGVFPLAPSVFRPLCDRFVVKGSCVLLAGKAGHVAVVALPDMVTGDLIKGWALLQEVLACVPCCR